MMNPNSKPERPAVSGTSEAEVAKRAYEIWERDGRPHGRDWDHWLAAEREIAGEASPGAASTGRARARPAAAPTAEAAAAKPKKPRPGKPASRTL